MTSHSEAPTADERLPDDYFDDCDGSDGCMDGEDEIGEDCHVFFESPSPNAVFVCGAVGSEDCDECPMNNWLGLTNRQIDELEESDE